MDAEVEFLRDQVQRLNSALSKYQYGQHDQSTASQVEKEEARMGELSSALWISDRSIMAPLMAEYDRYMDEMTVKLQRYQAQTTDIKVKLENVVKENERLHAELRQTVEKQFSALSVTSGVEGNTLDEETITRNLQEQIQLSEQERAQAMDLWQTASQELDRLQQAYQKNLSDGKSHSAQTQQLKDQIVQFQQHTHKLQVANQRLESTNKQFLKTVMEQSTEMEEMHRQLRQAKADLRAAKASVDEMSKLQKDFKEQMQRWEEDVSEARGREGAADRRLQQLQAAMNQQEARIKAASQEAEAVRRERTIWERKAGQLQAQCNTLEEDRNKAIAKVRESVQVAEEVTLQKDKALLREKHKADELEKIKETIKQLIQNAAVRTRKEVDNVRKQCNGQIHLMAEELSALQLKCADRESQIERLLPERKALEEELAKVYKEGRTELDLKKIDALHQRCLDAERMKDVMSLTLQRTQDKLKKIEVGYSEELSQCQAKVQKLQSSLAAARNDCISTSNERLQLQQENLQRRREMDELYNTTLLIQKKAKQQVLQMEEEYSLKEKELEARMRELEKCGRSSGVDPTLILPAQQKSTQSSTEESYNLTRSYSTKIVGLKAELNRQKQLSHGLKLQLETDHNEYKRLLVEYQEKTERLQKQLIQAEQKTKATTQQPSMLSSERIQKKMTMLDLESP